MKKLKIIILSMLSLFLFPNLVLAATGTVTLSGSNTAILGNKITVSVIISSKTKMGSWQMKIGYDKNLLQLTSSTAPGGGAMIVDYVQDAKGITKKSYKFTFKTLKKGLAKISVIGAVAYDFENENEISLKSSSKQIKIITQEELEASYSKNNNLKSLSVNGFELTPQFQENVLEYNLAVPENIKEINILGEASDNKSTINGLGIKPVTSGQNTFDIIVKAENGSEKTYKIIVEVKDINPINVKIADQDYTIVKVKDNLPAAPFYQEKTININGQEVPCYLNDNTKITLVGLKNGLGEIKLFIYEEQTQEYQDYYEIGVSKVTIYPMDTEKELKGYAKKELEINGLKLKGYRLNNNSRFLIIYGMNVETGEKGFYTYDKKDQNVMKYNDEYIKILLAKEKTYSYIVLTFSAIFVIMLVIIASSKKSNKKLKKKQENSLKLKKQVKEDA